MAKATQAQYLERVKQVEAMLLDAEPRGKIIEHGMNSWGVSDNAVEQYITAAYIRIKQINKATIDENKGWILRNYLEHFKRARSAADLKEERLCLDSISRVLGLELAPAEQAPRLEVPDQELDKAIEQESVH